MSGNVISVNHFSVKPSQSCYGTGASGMPTLTLQRRQFAIVALGAIVSAASWLAVRPWDIHRFMIGAPFGRDYVNFWMAPRLAITGSAATLVDIPAYNNLIKILFSLNHDPGLLFVYPPHSLLFLVAIAQLPFAVAVSMWTSINLAALIVTLRLIQGRLCPVLVMAVCLSPPSVAMIMYGHMAGLLALCSTVTIMAANSRPRLAGFCLACLTIKPQYAGALGLILLLSGQWRCLGWAAIVTAMLFGLSVLLFGSEIWLKFVEITMPLQSSFITDFKAGMISTSFSSYFGARLCNLPAWLAWCIQASVASIALFAAVKAARCEPQTSKTLLVILLGALAMQPYASHYDLALIAPAMTTVVLDGEVQADPFTVGTWILAPFAPVLFVLQLPILCVIVPLALITQSLRMLDRQKSFGRTPAIRPLAAYVRTSS